MSWSSMAQLGMSAYDVYNSYQAQKQTGANADRLAGLAEANAQYMMNQGQNYAAQTGDAYNQVAARLDGAGLFDPGQYQHTVDTYKAANADYVGQAVDKYFTGGQADLYDRGLDSSTQMTDHRKAASALYVDKMNEADIAAHEYATGLIKSQQGLRAADMNDIITAINTQYGQATGQNAGAANTYANLAANAADLAGVNAQGFGSSLQNFINERPWDLDYQDSQDKLQADMLKKFLKV